MTIRTYLTCLTLAAAAALPGCAGETRRIDASSNEGLTTAHDVNFKDWQDAAATLTDSLLGSTVLASYDKNNQAVMMVSNVKNSTAQHLDTQLLTNKIRIALLKSGKVLTTTAIGKNADDSATREVRDLAHDPMVDPTTVQPGGTVQAPKFSLSGVITQIRVRDDGTSESYFNFKLTLTDLKTGLAIWEDEKEIAKQTTKSSAGW
jgi:hypothetical protein